jgi:hypothetical protein
VNTSVITPDAAAPVFADPAVDQMMPKSCLLCMVQMLPGVLWVDSSPSNGIITLAQPLSSQRNEATNAGAAAAAAAADVQQQQQQAIKRWGNPQNPKYGDVHFYDYKNDCQVGMLALPCLFLVHDVP